MSEPNIEYPLSDARRVVNTASVLIFGPPAMVVVGGVAAESMVEHRTWNPLYRDHRIGSVLGHIIMWKTQSLPDKDKQTATGAQCGYAHPDASPVARRIREEGWDELLQILQVARGQLHFPGTRPVDQKNYDKYKEHAHSLELFQEWELGLMINAGVISTGEIWMKQFPDHADPELQTKLYNTRMALEVQDLRNASFKKDVKIVTRAAKLVLGMEVDMKAELKAADKLLEQGYVETESGLTVPVGALPTSLPAAA
jgi:lipopolysaccharide/colanic/teichoic acid biosynthesis glycosyltransferase